MMRPAGGEFERVPLMPRTQAGFEGVLFHIEKATDYYVEANGVRSPMFSMEVVELPTVDHLVLEYHFPAYTGLEPRTIDPGGDVAAIQGTEVRIKVTPTMTTPGGRILLNDNDSAVLTRSRMAPWPGSSRSVAQGFYPIELEGPKAKKSTRRRSTPSTCSTICRPRWHSPSRAATPRPILSRRSSPKCGPTTTSA